MHKVVFSQSISSIDDLCSEVKREYMKANISTPFPAANRQLQLRLVQFVDKSIPEKQNITYFDKVNSKRIYALEKQDNLTRLIVIMNESDKAKSLVLLPIDDEIKTIVSSFIEIFKATGYIASAAKCHERLSKFYAISDKRIRLVQRIVAKFIFPISRKNVNENSKVEENEHENDKTTNAGKEPCADKENTQETGQIEDIRNDNEHKQRKDDDQHRNEYRHTHIHNYNSSLLFSSTTTNQRTIMTRSQSKLNQIKHISLDKHARINRFDKAERVLKNSNTTD